MSDKSNIMKYLQFFCLWFCISFFAPIHAQAREKNCAIVLMHGKWGTAQSIYLLGKRYDELCDFKTLEMPWSKRRNYDQAYPQALDDIQTQVKEFRAQGYQTVVLVGHSFGANAALAYVSTVREKVDAVVALAPGHDPFFMYEHGQSEQADMAQALVNEGKKNEMVSILDNNQGVKSSFRMTAEVAWSYFDPNGLGNMSLSASHYSTPVPTMIVVGDSDPGFKRYRAFIFEKLPQNSMNQYLEVVATHKSTPETSATQVLEWLRKIVAP